MTEDEEEQEAVAKSQPKKKERKEMMERGLKKSKSPTDSNRG